MSTLIIRRENDIIQLITSHVLVFDTRENDIIQLITSHVLVFDTDACPTPELA
jgi:hypothetical protein